MSDSDSSDNREEPLIEPLETNQYTLEDVGHPFKETFPVGPLPLGPIFSQERDRYNPFQKLSCPRIACYYLTYASAAIHLIAMLQMNWWCNYSKLVIAYSC